MGTVRLTASCDACHYGYHEACMGVKKEFDVTYKCICKHPTAADDAGGATDRRSVLTEEEGVGGEESSGEGTKTDEEAPRKDGAPRPQRRTTARRATPKGGAKS